MKRYVNAAKENKLLPYLGQDVWVKVHHSNTYAYIRLLKQDGNDFLYNKIKFDYCWEDGKYVCSQAMQERILTKKYRATRFFWTLSKPTKTRTTEDIFNITDSDVESAYHELDEFIGKKGTWVKCIYRKGYERYVWVNIISEKNNQYVFHLIDDKSTSTYDLSEASSGEYFAPKTDFKVCKPLKTLTFGELSNKIHRQSDNENKRLWDNAIAKFKETNNLVDYKDNLNILKQYENSDSFILTYFKDSMYSDNRYPKKEWIQIVSINSKKCVYTIWEGKHWTYKQTSLIKFMFLPKDIQVKSEEELIEEGL